MLDVFEPFEVGNSDTSTIAKNIGEEADASSQEDILSTSGGWSICSLDYQFAVEFLSVIGVDCLLESSGDEDVTK